MEHACYRKPVALVALDIAYRCFPRLKIALSIMIHLKLIKKEFVSNWVLSLQISSKHFDLNASFIVLILTSIHFLIQSQYFFLNLITLKIHLLFFSWIFKIWWYFYANILFCAMMITNKYTFCLLLVIFTVLYKMLVWLLVLIEFDTSVLIL